MTLAVVVAFLGVAVFSSLHKHDGARNRCSLNGFDQLMTGEAEAAQTFDAAIWLEWNEALTAPLVHVQTASHSLFLRGPPTVA